MTTKNKNNNKAENEENVVESVPPNKMFQCGESVRERQRQQKTKTRLRTRKMLLRADHEIKCSNGERVCENDNENENDNKDKAEKSGPPIH